MGPPGGGFHLPTRWGGRELFPIHGEVPTEGRGWGRRVGAFTSPLAGEVGNSSPFMGKYRPKVGEGAAGWGLSPPHLLGRSARRAGWGYGSAGNLPTRWGGRELFPIHGEVPTEGRGRGRRVGAFTSPLAGEVGPQGRVGVRISRKPPHLLGRSGTLPHSWGSTDRRSGMGPPGTAYTSPLAGEVGPQGRVGVRISRKPTHSLGRSGTL